MDRPNDEQVPQTAAATRNQTEYKPTADEAELIRLSELWMETARQPRDKSVIRMLRQIMAPDFSLQIWDARRAALPLESWLQRGQGVGSEFGYDGLSAQVIGDIGIVYSRFWWSGSFQEKPFFDRGFLLDLWRRVDQSWQVFSRRSAPVEQISQLRQTPT